MNWDQTKKNVCSLPHTMSLASGLPSRCLWGMLWSVADQIEYLMETAIGRNRPRIVSRHGDSRGRIPSGRMACQTGPKGEVATARGSAALSQFCAEHSGGQLARAERGPFKGIRPHEGVLARVWSEVTQKVGLVCPGVRLVRVEPEFSEQLSVRP